MMKKTRHTEVHSTGGETIRDIIIGMSDGLTVPFALAAGLTGAVSGSSIIVTAGLAEVAAGAISMGLGGYLAARSDADHYLNERKREQLEIIEKTEAEKSEVRDVFVAYGLSDIEIEPIVEALKKKPKADRTRS
jgi:VIT1/CCC1 family predicted Fe2+/Mn2+ transporter